MTNPAATVRIGFLGAGLIATYHSKMLRRSGAPVVRAGVFDPDTERAAAFSAASGHTVYADEDAVIADCDAVYICTWTSEHPRQLAKAVAAGKHVFCEKPLSLELDECLAVEAEAARHPRLKVMIGYVRRFDASYQDAQRKIASGAIGRPFLVRSQTTDMNDPSGFFVRFAPKSGGIFLDMSVHDIDAARWLLGAPQPKRVFSVGTIAVHEGLADCGDVDNGIAVCEFEGGAMATIYASRTMAHGHETTTEIVGTAGRLVVGRDGRLNQVEIADGHGIRTETTPTFWERFEDAFLRETVHFVDCVRFDRPPGLTLHDATEATRIGIALRTSLVERRAVEL